MLAMKLQDNPLHQADGAWRIYPTKCKGSQGCAWGCKECLGQGNHQWDKCTSCWTCEDCKVEGSGCPEKLKKTLCEKTPKTTFGFQLVSPKSPVYGNCVPFIQDTVLGALKQETPVCTPATVSCGNQHFSCTQWKIRSVFHKGSGSTGRESECTLQKVVTCNQGTDWPSHKCNANKFVSCVSYAAIKAQEVVQVGIKASAAQNARFKELSAQGWVNVKQRGIDNWFLYEYTMEGYKRSSNAPGKCQPQDCMRAIANV